jgi:hypothetical protein
MHTKFHSENLKERDHLEDLGTDKIIIVEEVLGRTDRLLIFDTTWSTWKMMCP